MNEGWSIIESTAEDGPGILKREASFAWRGGEQRQTTGNALK